MTITTALKRTAPSALVLAAIMASGCASNVHAQSATAINEDDRGGQQRVAASAARVGVLAEDEAAFKVSFQCSSVAPGTLFAELSWPVAGAAPFATSTKRLALATEADGFASGSYGDIAISAVEPFSGQATDLAEQRNYRTATRLRGQALTVRRQNTLVARTAAAPTAMTLTPGQKNVAQVDPSLDYPTRLLAQLRVLGGAFDARATAPRDTVTLVGFESNMTYRFRLSDGAQHSKQYVFTAPMCVTDYVGAAP